MCQPQIYLLGRHCPRLGHWIVLRVDVVAGNCYQEKCRLLLPGYEAMFEVSAPQAGFGLENLKSATVFRNLIVSKY